MSKIEAFGVQLFLLLVLIAFGVFLLAGGAVNAETKVWIERIWDIVLVLLSPPAFAAAIQAAYKRGSPDENPNT